LMLDVLRLILGLIADLFRSRVSLEAAVLALRQQLNVLQRLRPKRPTFSSTDRLVLGWVCQLFPNARDAMAIVRPETVCAGIARAFEPIGAGNRGAGPGVRQWQPRSGN
jgi:hypothetical protein